MLKELRLCFARCHYCGVLVYKTYVLNAKGFHRRKVLYDDCATKDHTTPKKSGGKKTVNCCNSCNNKKGSMGYKEFKEYMNAQKT